MKTATRAEVVTSERGKIAHWNQSKGFGFIEHANGDDLFFHRSSLATGFMPVLHQHVDFARGVDRHGRPIAERVVAATDVDGNR